MLRTISRGLIMWRRIVPSLEWILSNVPDSIVDLCLKRPSDAHPAGTDYETINQAYCNITSGAALVLGMRFAGSCNKGAFEAVYAHLLKLLAISKRSVAELAGQGRKAASLSMFFHFKHSSSPSHPCPKSILDRYNFIPLRQPIVNPPGDHRADHLRPRARARRRHGWVR